MSARTTVLLLGLVACAPDSGWWLGMDSSFSLWRPRVRSIRDEVDIGGLFLLGPHEQGGAWVTHHMARRSIAMTWETASEDRTVDGEGGGCAAEVDRFLCDEQTLVPWGGSRSHEPPSRTLRVFQHGGGEFQRAMSDPDGWYRAHGSVWILGEAGDGLHVRRDVAWPQPPPDRFVADGDGFRADGELTQDGVEVRPFRWVDDGDLVFLFERGETWRCALSDAWLTEEQRDPWAWLCLVDRRGREVDEGTWMTEAPKMMISTGDRQGFVAVEGAER